MRIERSGLAAFVASFAIVIALLILTLARLRPPALVLGGVSADRFSAERARAVLREILGDERPHPVGSEANRRVRDRIVANLQRSAYRPQIQRTWECYGWADCAEVENIVARLEGQEPGHAVLIAAHYDSVGAGPGASDDGVGVAVVLEIARLLAQGPRPRNSIIFLIDDGEEAYLLGAAAFIKQHPWARDVRAVVNLEARGSSGLSFMFETSRDNAALIDLLAQHVPRPVTSSLYYSVYERLPNDTDFTVFKAAGIDGVNFAFIGDVQHYHTPLDNLANASPESIQHQGDNALAMVGALANARLPLPRRGDAIYFDLFSWTVVRWPERWNVSFLMLNGLLFGVAVILAVRRGLRIGQFLWGVGEVVIAVVAAVGLALAALMVMRMSGAAASNWVAYPAALLTFFWIAPFAVATAAALAFRNRAGLHGMWCATASLWLGEAALTAGALPGAIFIYLVPSLVMNLAAWLPGGVSLSLLLGSAAAAALLFPVAWPLYDVMGIPMMMVVAQLVVMVAITCAPLLAAKSGRALWEIPIVLGVISIAALGVATLLPPFSIEHPQRLTLIHHRDVDTNQNRWLVPARGHLPESFRRAAPWEQSMVQPFSWSPESYYTAEAPPELLDAAEIRLLERQSGVIRLQLIPSGNPHGASVFFPRTFISVKVNGRETRPSTARLRHHQGTRIVLHTVPHGGAEIELFGRVVGALEGTVEQRWYGVPPSSDPLFRVRPTNAVPSQEGDLTIVTKRFRIP